MKIKVTLKGVIHFKTKQIVSILQSSNPVQDKFNRHFRQNPYQSILSPKLKMSPDGHFKTFYPSNRHFPGY